jgi:hypothetical protein
MHRWQQQANQWKSVAGTAENVWIFVRSAASRDSHSEQRKREQLALMPENVIDTSPK